MDKPDWILIEEDYLATGMPYAKLAAKWNVPLSTLKKRAASGNWVKKFLKVAKEAELSLEPAPEPVPELVPREQVAVELRSQRYKRMIEATDSMMDRVIDALQVVKPGDTFAIGTLARALKDLREMQGLNRSALDIEEQQLRIRKLQMELQYHQLGTEPITVEFVNTEGAEC